MGLLSFTVVHKALENGGQSRINKMAEQQRQGKRERSKKRHKMIQKER